MLPYVPVPPACVHAAAERYDIPVEILYSVVVVEGGRPGMLKRNKNGSYDMGVMQINTKTWGPKLYAYFPKKALIEDPCTSVYAGAYIIAKERAETKDGSIWRAVARYHSRNPKYQIPYLHKVRRIYTKIKREFRRILLAQNN